MADELEAILDRMEAAERAAWEADQARRARDLADRKARVILGLEGRIAADYGEDFPALLGATVQADMDGNAAELVWEFYRHRYRLRRQAAGGGYILYREPGGALGGQISISPPTADQPSSLRDKVLHALMSYRMQDRRVAEEQAARAEATAFDGAAPDARPLPPLDDRPLGAG